MKTLPLLAAVLGASVALTLSAQQTPPAGGQQPAAPAQQPTEIRTIISSGDPGLPPKLAVPPFIALTNDSETQAAAKTIGEVLFDDIAFEKEFYMIPRDTYRSVPQPTSLDNVRLDLWKELGADGVLVGSIAKVRQRRDRAVPSDQRRERRGRDGQGVQRRGPDAFR